MYHRLADLLLELEIVMRKANMWEMEFPSQDDLLSQEPFCVDTLNFLQWLRFVLMPNFKIMIESSITLPTQCNILPMAEEYFSGGLWQQSESMEVLETIKCIDLLLSSTDTK
jgi:uncharacterized protein YqcC (DUF446 family)